MPCVRYVVSVVCALSKATMHPEVHPTTCCYTVSTASGCTTHTLTGAASLNLGVRQRHGGTEVALLTPRAQGPWRTREVQLRRTAQQSRCVDPRAPG